MRILTHTRNTHTHNKKHSRTHARAHTHTHTHTIHNIHSHNAHILSQYIHTTTHKHRNTTVCPSSHSLAQNVHFSNKSNCSQTAYMYMLQIPSTAVMSDVSRNKLRSLGAQKQVSLYSEPLNVS